MRVVFVHGACVRDGGWWWAPAAEALQSVGIGSAAPALPSCGEGDRPAGAHGPGLVDDVEAVRSVLVESDEPTLLVGHSYGGIVASEAAVGVRSVEHMVFVSSYLPEPGESLATFGAPEPPPHLDFDPVGGTFGAVAEKFGQVFVQDCPPHVVHEGATRLVRQSISVLQAPVRTVAWHDVPNTYVVCADVRGTPASAQRTFSRRADRVVELPTGHHPFLSRPQAVADLLVELA